MTSLVLSLPTTDDDGLFTAHGVKVMTAYANAWVGGERDLNIERQYPELDGSFYDVRSDSDFAKRWADVPSVLNDLDASLQKAGFKVQKFLAVVSKKKP